MQYQDLANAWARADLSDDFIFNKTFLDPALTKELLKRVLPTLRIRKIKILNTQHELVTTHDAKGLRFDIYAEDDQGRHFDVEMQVLNKHNLPQRIRFYQSTLAMDSYERGEDYIQARNAYVIFFCCFDPFDCGQQWYRVRRNIDNGPSYHIADGETTLCFDVTSLQRAVSPALQNLLDLIAGRQVEGDDNFVVQLRKRINYVKQNRKWRREYMLRTLYEMDIEHDRRQAVKQGKRQGLEQGIEQGMKQGIKQGMKQGMKQGIKQGVEQGKRQGMEQGVASAELQLVCDLINSGQTAIEVLKFLTTIRKWPADKAQRYYQKALDKLNN